MYLFTKYLCPPKINKTGNVFHNHLGKVTFLKLLLFSGTRQFCMEEAVSFIPPKGQQNNK